MTHRIVVLSALLLGVGSSSCTCSPGAPGDARFRFTAEGTGPTNAAPLNPLRVGSVLGSGRDTFIIDGVFETANGRELRMTNVFSGLVTRVMHASDGLFFTASTVDGSAPRPLLVVPKTVRVGMKWDVFGETTDTPLYSYEVVERTEVADSWFGPGILWGIDQTDSKGEVVARRYLEGKGSTSAPPRVLWSADPQVSPDSAPTVALEPLVAPASFSKRGWVESLSLVRIGEGPGLFLANDEAYENGGQIGWCGSWSGAPEAPVTDVMPSRGTPYRQTLGLECISTKYCASVTTQSGGFLDCSLEYVSGHASGAFVGSDLKVTWAPRTNAGTLAYADETRVGSDFTGTSTRTFAVVPDAQGFGATLSTHFAGYGDLLVLGTATQPLGDPAQPKLVPNNTLGLPDLQFVTPLSDDTGGRSTLLMQTSDGMLWSATFTGTTLSRPRRHARLAGRLSVQSMERGHEVLRVTADGLIQRVRVDAEGLGLEPVAQVKVATGEQVAGAFLWREAGALRLVVATSSYDGSDARGALVKLNLFRSTTTVTPQAVTRPHPANGVWAVTAGPNQDVLVCFAGTGPPELTGWTIGGVPAAAVAGLNVGGSCVQVFRPAGSAITPAGPYGSQYWTVEGPIPGQGRVTVRTALEPNLGLSANTAPSVMAPLTGGGFVSGRRLFGAGAVTLGVPTDLLDSEPSGAGCQLGGPCGLFADGWGNGLWANQGHPTRADVMSLRRLGLESFSMELPTGSGAELPSGGGGALVGIMDGGVLSRFYMAPDAGLTPLPTFPVEYALLGRLANGTLCGYVRGASRSFCQPTSGPEVTAPFPSDVSDLWPMLPTKDGVLLGLQPGGINNYLGLDPATGTLLKHQGAHLDPVLYTYGSDGTLYGLVDDTTPGVVAPRLAVRFSRTGVTPLTLPAGVVPAGDRLTRMYVDEQVILFVTQFQRMFVVPR